MRTATLFAALFAALFLTVAGPALAAPPEPPATEQAAERLHEAAKNAYKAKRLGQAAELWREAMRLRPHWKYAYNLATALFEDKRALMAWEYAVQAESLGLPAEHAVALGLLRASIADELRATHVRIELTVDPPDAIVQREGQPWPAPRGLWTQATSSRVTVSAPGFETQEIVWEHPIGRDHQRTVRLVRKQVVPATGRLALSGRPVGATIEVDGKPFGTLPLAEGELPVGQHTVVVRAPGHDEDRHTVTIAPGARNELRVALVTTSITTEPIAPRSNLIPTAWATAGSGIALIAIGGGLLGWSDSISDDMRQLDADRASLATMTYEQYVAKYDDLNDQHRDTRVAGFTLVGIGAAAALTGVTLFVVDAVRTEPDVKVSATPTQGGFWLQGSVSF